MPEIRMHPDQIDVDAEQVRRLLAAQFPEWRTLPIARFASTGTDNAIFRLGADLAVRMPIRPGAVSSVTKEWAWLPRLAPLLPLAVPAPIAIGEPDEGYPWRWSVTPWLRGESATPERIGHSREAAVQLAEFVRALQQVDPADGPGPSAENFNRGAPLAQRDSATRRTLAALEALGDAEPVDLAAATEAWERALEEPEWDRGPVWLHGDLLAGNLLATADRLTAVLDFETLGVGDPACDMMPAWAIFRGSVRTAYRAALKVDDATWRRGRGWALWQSLGALPYYRITNPRFAAAARHTLAEVLADRD